MHVLVCDDDKATRFAARKMLEGSFGCRVTECTDGVEALKLLDREHFALLLLDIEMPTLNGIDTLEEIRESPRTRDLPVIVLSFTRDERNVVRLIELGITDYILKPIHEAVALEKLERLIRTLPAEAPRAVDMASIRLSKETPALLVDGNLDFRFFFASQVKQFGRLTEADSGAAAIAAFRSSPVPLVFIGGDLGVVTEERLNRKLRELSRHAIRLVRLAEADEIVADPSAYDSVVTKSYIPDSMRFRLSPYIFEPGPLNSLTVVLPELANILDSGVRQVFGMMFDADVKAADMGRDKEIAFGSRTDIEIGERFVAQLRVQMDRTAALNVASRMFSMPEAELIDDDCASTVQELGNLLMGRIVARCRDRALTCNSQLPVADIAPARHHKNESLVQAYALPTGSPFQVSITIVDRLDTATRSAASAASAA